MAALRDFRRRLLEVGPTDWPVLTASVDLTPGATGEPTAFRLLRDGMREARADWPVEIDVVHSLDDDAGELKAAMEEALANGAHGLFYVGSAAADLRMTIELPVPFRNGLHLGIVPRLFEFERQRYLVERPVCIVVTDAHSADIVRVSLGELQTTDRVEHDQNAIDRSKGRSTEQGRSGAARGGGALSGGGPGAGGGSHSKNRVERSIEEHRRMFGREAAEHIERLVDDDTLLFIAGPVEARSEVLNQLDDRVAERALEAPHMTTGATTRELLEIALELAREEQVAEADREAERCLGGEHLDRTTMGIEAVRGAIERGEVGTLVLHEDAVDHFGDALDARYHEAGSNPEAIEGLLRAALDLSAECRFSRVPALLSEQEGVVAVRRW